MRSLLRIIAVISVCLFADHANAQVQVAPFLTPNQQFFDNNGNPLTGGKVCTFAAGTTTQQASYSDLGVTLNSNPVVLDSAGRGNIYLTVSSYKIVTAASTANSQCSPAITSADNVTWANLASTLASLTVNGAAKIASGTPATSGANQSSPNNSTCGNFWNGTASAQDCWNWIDTLGTGTNPTSTLTLTHSGSSGTTALNFAPPLTFGTINVTGNASVGNNLTVTNNENVSGTSTVAISAVTGNQTVGGNDTITGILAAPTINGTTVNATTLNAAAFNGIIGSTTPNTATITSLTSKNENGDTIIHVDQYASWAAALADCPTNGCTLDGRSPNTPTALGTIDTGVNPRVVKILLGPMTYTVDHIVLRSGLNVIGSGIENVQGTEIQAVGVSNQAPFVMPPPSAAVSVQGVILQDFSINGTAGNTSQDGIKIDLTGLGTGSNFEFSRFSRIQYGGFFGSFLHLKGSSTLVGLVGAIQGNIFDSLIGSSPITNATIGTNLRMEGGEIGQNTFINNWYQVDTGPNGTLAYCGNISSSDTTGPYSNWWYGTTIQGGGAAGVLLEGCKGATFYNSHAEGNNIIFQLKGLAVGWHNEGIVLDGGLASGNNGVNAGAGAIVDASDASNTSNGTLTVKNWTIEGTPDKFVKGVSGGSEAIVLDNNEFSQSSPSTSNVTPVGISTSSTTLTTGTLHYAAVAGASGGAISTISSNLAPGETLKLFAAVQFQLAIGVNIGLGGRGSPITVLPGQVISLVLSDNTGGWQLLDAGSSSTVKVASDFSTASTSLTTISGLTWVVDPTNTGSSHSFHCSLLYSQATAAASNQFGIQVATIAPVNVMALAAIATSATATTYGNIPTLATTTATPFVSFTPSATATNFVALLEGTIELPSGVNTINMMVLTGSAADTITVKKDSYCVLY